MNRPLLATLFFALLATWASAQPAKRGPQPHELVQLLKRNESLHKKLVEGSLKMAKQSGSALARSESYDAVIRELEGEITRAADANDAPRVAELGGHLNSMLEKGLVPNLAKARRLASEGSDAEKKLIELRELTIRMSGDVAAAIAKSRIAKSPEAKAVVEALKGNREQVEKEVNAPAPR